MATLKDLSIATPAAPAEPLASLPPALRAQLEDLLIDAPLGAALRSAGCREASTAALARLVRGRASLRALPDGTVGVVIADVDGVGIAGHTIADLVGDLRRAEGSAPFFAEPGAAKASTAGPRQVTAAEALRADRQLFESIASGAATVGGAPTSLPPSTAAARDGGAVDLERWERSQARGMGA